MDLGVGAMDVIFGSDMHHKRRRRPRRILQKKEELSEEVELTLSTFKGRMTTTTTTSSTSSTSASRIKTSNKIRTRSCIPWAVPLRSLNVNLVLLGLLLSIFSSNVQGQPPPLPPAGFLDFDNLPVTRFSCEGKVIGGYYADVETGCQMFHVCTLGQKDEVQDIKFLCLNGTVFDQETRVCERVDEVDCSKAEEYFDLNLDLYVPHVATPKPADPDLEPDDDFIRPVSTPKPPPPTTTTLRTTLRTTTTTTTTTTPRPRTSPTRSPPTKGFSSFNYYLKTPHSHVSSGYNSQSRQSYLINHNPGESEKPERYAAGNENTGRKIPSGQKTILYSSPASSTSRSRNPPRNSIEATTTPPPKEEDLDEQYQDEYYDDELPIDYDVSSSTSGSRQPPSKQSSYELQQSNNNNNKNIYQQQHQYRPKPAPNPFDYRDGRSTTSSKSSNRGVKNSETKSHVSVAISSSRSTKSPPQIKTPAPIKHTTVVAVINTTTEEPYYYDDDYPEDALGQEQPAIIVRSNMPSSTTGRSATGMNTKGNGGTTGPSGTGQAATGDGENAEYYDDVDGDPVNVNEHHFIHVDVPRIPFAKPNVPRVLVTNGKPFLPRLRRQSAHHHYPQGLQLHQHQAQHQQQFPPPTMWERFVEEDAKNKKRRKRNAPVLSRNYRI